MSKATFQEIILKLQNFWAEHGAALGPEVLQLEDDFLEGGFGHFGFPIYDFGFMIDDCGGIIPYWKIIGPYIYLLLERTILERWNC